MSSATSPMKVDPSEFGVISIVINLDYSLFKSKDDRR